MELRRSTHESIPYSVMAQAKVRRPIAVMFDLMADYMGMTRPEAFREAIFRLLKQEGLDRPKIDVHPMTRRVRRDPALADKEPEGVDTILMQTKITYDQHDRVIKAETCMGIVTPMFLRQAIYKFMFDNGYKFNRPKDDLPVLYGEDDK